MAASEGESEALKDALRWLLNDAEAYARVYVLNEAGVMSSVLQDRDRMYERLEQLSKTQPAVRETTGHGTSALQCRHCDGLGNSSVPTDVVHKKDCIWLFSTMLTGSR